MVNVAVLNCTEYGKDIIKESMLSGLNQLNFDLSTFKGKNVVLKPNLLMGAHADKAITTHPEFFRAIVQIVKAYDGIPIIAENPAISAFEKTLQKSGYGPIIDEEEVQVANVSETRVLFCEQSKTFKRFEISAIFFDADIIINLPKFKTHGITYITGAVKNLFGTIPGLNKSRCHTKAPTSMAFAEFLLDLNQALMAGFEKPKTFLHIMDAIVGMEGEGPGPTGKPKPIGAVIIGQNQLAVDYAAVDVAGLDYHKVPTIVQGFNREWGVASKDDIVIIGDPIEAFRVKGFKPTQQSFASNGISRWPFSAKWFRNLITEKPVPDEKDCTLCLKCRTICPAKAICVPEKSGKVPIYDYDKCIRCYCCMEICPSAAIGLKRGNLQWMMDLID